MSYFRIFFTSLFLFTIALQILAQEPQNSAFEGELHFRTMENHDKKVIKFSLGMAYNGARDIKYLIKGNKVLYKDESTKMHILLDPDNDCIILYSTCINKGMKFKYDNYAGAYMSSFSGMGPKTKQGYALSTSNYKFEILDDNYKYKDYDSAQCIKGRIENEYAGTSIDIINIPNIKLPQAMYHAQLHGIAIDGLIAKFTWEQMNKSILGTMKSYCSSELKKMINRNVEDSEFDIPSEISIEISESPFKVCELYKKNHKYLKKNKLYPTQKNKKVIYEINEEWDF